jgi:hypothetical protein
MRELTTHHRPLSADGLFSNLVAESGPAVYGGSSWSFRRTKFSDNVVGVAASVRLYADYIGGVLSWDWPTSFGPSEFAIRLEKSTFSGNTGHLVTLGGTLSKVYSDNTTLDISVPDSGKQVARPLAETPTATFLDVADAWFVKTQKVRG